MPPTSHLVSTPPLPSPTGEALCIECANRGTGCCSTDPALTHLSFPISEPEWRRILPYAALATEAPVCEAQRFAAEEEKAMSLPLPPTPPDPASQAAWVDSHGPADSSGVADSFGPAASSGATGETGETGATGSREPAAYPAQGDSICASEPNTPDFIASMKALFPKEKSRMLALFPEGGRHLTMRTRCDGSCVFLGSGGCRLPRTVRPWYCLMFPAWVTSGSLTLFLSQDCLISQKARGPAHGISLLGVTPDSIRRLHRKLCADWGLDTGT